MTKKSFTPTQIEIIRAYIKLIGKRIHHPTLDNMNKVGITREKLRHHFTNLAGLREAAKAYSPDTFLNIIDSSIFSPKHLHNIREKVGKKDTFIITTAVTGCEAHKGFYQAMKRYCERNKAMIVVLPSTDPAAKAGWEMDGILKKEAILMADMKLNSNCFLSSIKLSAKHIDPVTGLGRIGQRQGSFIYASPKQRLKVIPNVKGGFPRVMMTTGACTVPNYSTDRYMSERTAYISTIDHVIGAIIVEVEDDEVFHFRQIQAEKSGAFVDMGVYYKPDGIGKLLPVARILGDYHAGQHDSTAEAAFLRLQRKVPAQKVLFHDLFNGLSVNHHENNKHILRAIRHLNGDLILENELKHAAKVLDTWGEVCQERVVVKSNHDEFLSKYLDEGRYVKDYPNKIIALKLALAMAEGQDPLRFGVQNLVGLKDPKSVQWLTRKMGMVLAGVQVGDHGDTYAASSMYGQEHAYGNAVTAHIHAPEILRGIFRVGTTSLLDLDYNDGPSAWMHTGCDLYPNGARTLINVIDGRCSANDSAKA